jgi:hypothetical protein
MTRDGGTDKLQIVSANHTFARRGLGVAVGLFATVTVLLAGCQRQWPQRETGTKDICDCCSPLQLRVDVESGATGQFLHVELRNLDPRPIYVAWEGLRPYGYSLPLIYGDEFFGATLIFALLPTPNNVIDERGYKDVFFKKIEGGATLVRNIPIADPLYERPAYGLAAPEVPTSESVESFRWRYIDSISIGVAYMESSTVNAYLRSSEAKNPGISANLLTADGVHVHERFSCDMRHLTPPARGVMAVGSAVQTNSVSASVDCSDLQRYAYAWIKIPKVNFLARSSSTEDARSK